MIQNKPTQLCLAVALLCATVAHAGFLDARGDGTGGAGYVPPPAMNANPVLPFVPPPPPPPVMAPVMTMEATGKVVGELADKAWRAKMGKPRKGGASITQAIYAIVPPSVVAKGLEIDGDIPRSAKFTWRAGRTKADALRDLADKGKLYINVSARDGVTVQKAELPAPPPVMVQAPPRVREPMEPARVFGPSRPSSQTPAVTYGPTPNQDFTVRSSGTPLPPLATSGRSVSLDMPQNVVMPAQPMPLDAPASRNVMVAPPMMAPAGNAMAAAVLPPPPVIQQLPPAAQVPASTRAPMAAPTPLPTLSSPPILSSVSAVPMPVGGSPLVIDRGQRLMPSLRSWLSERGIDLSWEATGNTQGKIRDVMLESPVRIAARDVPSVLTEVLAPFGFEAQIEQGSPVRVVVKNSAMEGYQQ